MRSTRFTIGITLLNALLFLGTIAVHARTALANPQAVPSVLRARALEIVDAQGNVRFDVTVSQPTTVNGKHYPDRVMMRMGSPGAGPGVKLLSSVEGTTLGIMHNDQPRIHVTASGDSAYVKLVGVDKQERMISQ